MEETSDMHVTSPGSTRGLDADESILTPYLDVMTVSTSQFPTKLPASELEPHSVLLVEPVSVPKLGHTGVSSAMFPQPAKLSYPTGAKRLSVREEIKHTIEEKVYAKAADLKPVKHPLKWDDSTKITPLPLSLDLPAVTHSQKKAVIGPARPAKSLKSRGTGAKPGRSPTPEVTLDGKAVRRSGDDRAKEERTRDLIHSLRATNQLIDRMTKMR